MFQKTPNIRTLFIRCSVFFIALIAFGTPFEAEARTLPVPLIQGSAPTEVVISGPSVGTINVTQTFTATVVPGSVTTPITYTWVVWKSEGSIDGSETIIHTNGGLSDNLSFTWIGGGFKRISVRAENTNGYAIDEVFFPVEVPPFLTSPYPLPARATSVFDHSTPRYESDPNDYVLTWLGIRDNIISYDGHSGIDYAFGYLPIYAAADSVEVVFAGWKVPTNHNADVGLHVKLRHPNGYYTIYGHLNSTAVKSCSQSYCASVQRGNVIGISGDTGNSSGPHLHFEVRTPYDGAYGTQVDPYGYSASPESLDEDKERPAWTHTQPNSIWVDYPDVSIGSMILPDGAGNALDLPDTPNNGVTVDDYAHLPNDSAPNFSAETGCWERSSQKPADYAENDYNLYKNAVIGTDENDYIGTCWARWYLPSDQSTGEYSIYVHIPRSDTDNFADNVLYRLIRDGIEIAKVNVSQFGINRPVLTGNTYSADSTVDDGWIYIGSYLFSQSDNFDNYVELTDKVIGDTINVNDSNNPTVANPKVAVDAVKFVRSASSANVDAVLIIDSSGSMGPCCGNNDPQNMRLQASRLFVTGASVQDDYVGVIDFDNDAIVVTNPPLQKLHDNDSSVVSAINTIDSSGGTNIGLGLQKGCDLLIQSDRTGYRKGAILLTDGDGGFSGQDACYIGKGWPIFTFGFGDANDALLQQIASNTGGRYVRVNNLTSLTCEFIRVRTLIANAEPSPCLPYNVPPFGSVAFSQPVAPGEAQATFSTGWPGSDVVMTLTSPSSRVIDRNTVAPDVIHENGATYEVYTILNPEPGNWNVNLYGADVPTGGEEVIFGFASVPDPEPSAPPIFADGFENGNFSAWWWADENNDLTVSTQAAAVGNYGMQAVVNDADSLMVYDNSPVDQKHYSARFYLDPNSINIPNGQGAYIFAASDNIGWMACLYLKHIGESYLLNLCGKDDARTWFETDGVYINDAWTEVELEWQAASAPGANNGYLKLWINDTPADGVQNLDSDTLFIKYASLGMDGQPANTTGTMYFDAFESHAGSHIGLDPNGPALYTLPAPPDSIFADGFESNNLDAWDWAETNGGNLSTSAQAVAVGNYGMQAVITGGSTMAMTEASVVNVLDESDPFFFNPESESSPNGLEYLLNSFMPEMVVYDNTPRAEKHYDVRFYFDPNSVDLPNGQGMYLFSASDEHWVICLYLERRGGQYRLSLCGEANNQIWLENRYVYIADDWQAIEIEWQAASAPGANNGYMKLFINDVLADEFQNLDNDQRSITGVVLGVDGIPDGTSGTVYFDAFDSHRSTHIGLDPNGPAPSPTNTGWISPAANAAVISSAGDNNGFQTNPTNAYSDGGGFAVDTNSGTNTNTSCSNSGKDRHVFHAYGLPSFPNGSSILGIEVRLDMKVDSTSGSPKSCVELSWDGGATWTPAKTTATFTISEATYILGGSSDTWGRAWTTNELSNLRVRITNVSSKSTSDFSLDWVPVRVTYLPPAPPLTLIFTDGFETGDLSSWNYTETGNGRLSASAASAISGSYGMQAVITDTTDLYVEYWTTAAETYYSARFYFDPNSVSIPNGGTFYILSNSDLRLLFKNNAGTYQVRADIKTDSGTWANGTFVNITNSRQLLEVEWKAATANGANDGFLKFWIDDALVDTRSNVDNDTRVINYIDLGAMWSIPSGTSGTIYFDNFESRRGEHIGP